MESEGQRASTNPTAVLASLMSKRERLQEELDSVEKQVYELETSYLQDSSRFGNALKGSEGIFSSSKYTTNLKRSRKFHPEDRLFSLSSVTSPASFSSNEAVLFVFRLKNVELVEMMGDLILVKAVRKVEAYLQVDKGN
ncbi:uncharacterized protein LOC131150686 isoform X2 [Malania oleifera]|uniref:uncharacterized protein LOC131150686 isoform X2 n=1 Tax=Malania oleifera TaxID=397392 RepID=UPI0025AE7EE5|nr:uncharacterized protein LOC131150686 isoform X2 [Malania oleifera]